MNNRLQRHVIRNIRHIVMVGTETVINEVRNRECLWNPHDGAYKNKFEKLRAWQEVCAKVAPDYNTTSNEEKREIERAVQLRWKTARDAYFKCKGQAKKSTYKSKNKYVFYEALTFLERIKDSGAEDVSDDSLPEMSIANEEQTDPLKTETVIEPPRPIPQRKFQKKRRRVMEPFETRLLRSMQSMTNTPAASNSQSQLQEDDQAFFNSLAPILKDFDSYKKLVFRSRILELAMDIGDIRSSTVTQLF